MAYAAHVVAWHVKVRAVVGFRIVAVCTVQSLFNVKLMGKLHAPVRFNNGVLASQCHASAPDKTEQDKPAHESAQACAFAN